MSRSLRAPKILIDSGVCENCAKEISEKVIKKKCHYWWWLFFNGRAGDELMTGANIGDELTAALESKRMSDAATEYYASADRQKDLEESSKEWQRKFDENRRREGKKVYI